MSIYESIRSELTSLVCALASRTLAGRVADVRFKEPPLSWARGLAFKNGHTAVIYVDPDLDDRQTLSTILHEFAHIKRDFKDIAPIETASTLKGKYRSEIANLMPSSRENFAKGQAQKWLDVCDELEPGGDFLQKLAAVSRHYSTGTNLRNGHTR